MTANTSTHSSVAPDWDGVLIFHAEVAIDLVVDTVRELRLKRPLLLTSHEPFPNERHVIAARCAGATIMPMADLTDDASLAACDATAADQLSTTLPKEHRAGRWMTAFERASVAEKNALVARRLADLIGRPLHEIALRYAVGLGIAAEPWRMAGGEAFGPAMLTETSTPARPRRSALFARSPVHAVFDDNELWLLLGPVHRVRFRHGLRPWKLPGRFFPRVVRGIPRLTTAALQALGRGIGPAPRLRLATTIHGYEPGAFGGIHPLYLLLDGFHPPNYTRSYRDGYDAETRVVVSRDFINERWWLDGGFRTIRQPRWLESAAMSPVRPRPVRTILLALNHAGDWSALISRSDTDRLLVAFAALAPKHADLTFIVRPHPTMTHARHEGPSAIDRIHEFVETSGCANLRVSSLRLEDDLARADLVVSEYSQVLIDAWTRGLLGLAANVTERRSYLEAYRELGFREATGEHEIHEAVAAMTRSPEVAAARQSEACERFNTRLARWRNEEGEADL